MPSKNYLGLRLQKFQKRIKESEVDGFYIENPVNLYYFTGIHMSSGQLYILEKAAHLFVDGRYIEKCKGLSIPCSLPEKAKGVFPKSTRFGFDDTQMCVARKTALDKSLKLFARKDLIQLQRAIKDDIEIKLIKKSASLLLECYKYIKSQLKVGVTEKEIALKFQLYALKNGAERLSFDTIVAFGKATSMPHYTPTNQKLKKGHLVLLDMGVVVDDYASDMTRMHFFGKKDPKLVEIYNVTREAHARALTKCKPGINLHDLDNAAREVITKASYGKAFMHSLGHGVGLEVHEYPPIRQKVKGNLKEGMVITIEPGIYLPGKGGVRHEDMLLITKSGYKNLTDLAP